VALSRREFLGAAALAAAPASRQPAGSGNRHGPLDALFEAFNRPGTPGIGVGVLHRGEVLHASGYGCADLENSVPVDERTVFHVASVSKQFTAFAIALLAAEGRLDLDADVRRYLPCVPDFGSPITTRHLVHHTSGLRDQWTLFDLGGQEIRNVLRQRQVMSMVARQRALDFAPGSDYSYSNTGYTLMAEIVAAVTGRSFRQFSRERIFAPLGMRDSFFLDDVSEIVPRRAQSYHRRSAREPWRRALLNYETVGATSLHTTVDDMLRWARNLSRPTVGDRALIGRLSAGGALADGSPIPYGYGLERGEICGHDALLHTGWDAGFRSLFAWLQRADLAVVLLRNSLDEAEDGDCAADLFDPANSIVETCLGRGSPAISGVGADVAQVEAPSLADVEGSYLSEFGRKLAFDAAGGRLTMREGFGPARTVVFRTDGSFDCGCSRIEHFRLQRSNARIVGIERFRRDRQGLRPIVYRRVAAHEATGGDPARYVGDYRSAELDVTYHIERDAEGLFARMIWAAQPLRLLPVAPGRFECAEGPLQVLSFDTDDRARITGFRAHSGRARNVWFERAT
jgi:CubicO group peptidase (beta-lactamase class C family)